MDHLNGSVGRDGRNDHDDVLGVQRALNQNAHLIGLALPLPEDGNLDALTAAAIISFQRAVVHISSPDGRVDPHGTTWRVLSGEHAQAVPAAFVQLPSDVGSYAIYTSDDKVFAVPSVILSIKTLADQVLTSTGIHLCVGDISYQNGGKMAPHASHRRGVDVDVRPLRNDGKEAPVTYLDPAYSRDLTQTLVDLAHQDPNLKFIFFNDALIHGVKPWVGHDNHLHLHFDP
jgi:hypothetical protein